MPEWRQNQMASEFRLRNRCVGSRPIEGGGGVPRGAPKVPAAGSRRTDGRGNRGRRCFLLLSRAEKGLNDRLLLHALLLSGCVLIISVFANKKNQCRRRRRGERFLFPVSGKRRCDDVSAAGGTVS